RTSAGGCCCRPRWCRLLGPERLASGEGAPSCSLVTEWTYCLPRRRTSVVRARRWLDRNLGDGGGCNHGGAGYRLHLRAGSGGPSPLHVALLALVCPPRHAVVLCRGSVEASHSWIEVDGRC